MHRLSSDCFSRKSFADKLSFQEASQSIFTYHFPKNGRYLNILFYRGNDTTVVRKCLKYEKHIFTYRTNNSVCIDRYTFI